jgi:hypothetical protein
MLVYNKSIDTEYICRILENDEREKSDYKSWYRLSTVRTDINPKFLLDNINVTWNWDKLSMNMPIEFILSNPDLGWTEYICLNKGLAVEIILDASDLYNYKLLSLRRDIPFSFILVNLDKDWLWESLSETYFQYIKDYPDLPWDYSAISINLLDSCKQIPSLTNKKVDLLNDIIDYSYKPGIGSRFKEIFNEFEI